MIALAQYSCDKISVSHIQRMATDSLAKKLHDLPAEQVSILNIRRVMVDVLIEYLGNLAPGTRREAASAFSGVAPSDYAIDRLETCLQSRSGGVRRETVRAFANVKWEVAHRHRVNDLLALQLQDTDLWVQQVVISTFFALGFVLAEPFGNFAK